ncbi:hypothetical protein R1sor_013387 [Riccia sorocarpa]|uniref:Uncharacterized protein n=1 Tax=Riccia sorocarpa TaxID=122646 RepID=A0ABD3H6E0_9MARC
MNPEVEIEALKEQVNKTQRLWQDDLSKWQTREAQLESEVEELKEQLVDVEGSARKEAELLTRRMKTADTLLRYLKSKAKIMSIPRYARTSCGIKQQEGVGLVDKRGVPMAEWNNPANIPLFGNASKSGIDKGLSSSLEDENFSLLGKTGDGEYVERMAIMVMQVTEVMEVLLKRAIMAGAEAEAEKERNLISQEELVKKTVQIENMWARVEEMERVAIGTSGVLKDMQSKLEDMEQETTRQRQRAAENEQELSRVRHDFGILRSSVDNLVKARETIRCMEKRIHEAEDLSERLTARVLSLESGKKQKETEVERLLVENDGLRSSLDFKTAELSAASDQVRYLVEQLQV